MANLICIKHPDYDSQNPPVLSCKTCCSMYIVGIKEKHSAIKPHFNASKWVAEQTTRAKAAHDVDDFTAFNPELI